MTLRHRCCCLSWIVTLGVVTQAPARADALGTGPVAERRVRACMTVVETVSKATGAPHSATIVDEYMFQLSNDAVLFHCDHYELLTMKAASPGVVSFLAKAWAVISQDPAATVASLIAHCRTSGEARHGKYRLSCSDGGNYVTISFDDPIGK